MKLGTASGLIAIGLVVLYLTVTGKAGRFPRAWAVLNDSEPAPDVAAAIEPAGGRFGAPSGLPDLPALSTAFTRPRYG